MALVARRKMTETWREAVARQAGDEAGRALQAFDDGAASGLPEAEAAYLALKALDRLAFVDLPGDPAATRRQVEPQSDT